MGLKAYLGKEYQNKDLGKLKYFLGIEVARSQKGIVISQRKYTLDLLEEIGKLGVKPIDTPVEQNHGLHSESGKYFMIKRHMTQEQMVQILWSVSLIRPLII